LKFPGLALPTRAFAEDLPQGVAGQCQGKTFLGCSAESSWMANVPISRAESDRCRATSCPGVTALTVAVQVTEIGTGGDAYGTLGKQVDDNKKTWEDA